MKVHQLARGLIFEHEPSLSLGCKRLRPLAPRLTPASDTVSSLDLKSFIRPESGPLRLFTEDRRSDPPPQVETHPGGTRWNPTQEQIGILEMLYRQGMRTPNAQQIEQITAQLGKYGKIEGKNVFYWFQNHKARERQKQKRSNTNTITTTVTTAPPPLMTPTTPSTNISFEAAATNNYICSGREREESSPYKRKCRSWSFESLEEDQSSRSTICKENDNNEHEEEGEEEEEEELRTLELFPLHPEAAAAS